LIIADAIYKKRRLGGSVKKCPFCSEEVLDDAVKCRFCGEWFSSSNNPKIYGVYDTYKATGKMLMLVGMLMMCGGCVSGIYTSAASIEPNILGGIIAIVGFILCIIGRFLE
jgi:hypothetical protein